MILKEYINHLQKLVENNPDCNELQVVYCRDSEGNGWEEVSFPPSITYREEHEVEQGDYLLNEDDIDDYDVVKVVVIN